MRAGRVFESSKSVAGWFSRRAPAHRIEESLEARRTLGNHSFRSSPSPTSSTRLRHSVDNSLHHPHVTIIRGPDRPDSSAFCALGYRAERPAPSSPWSDPFPWGAQERSEVSGAGPLHSSELAVTDLTDPTPQATALAAEVHKPTATLVARAAASRFLSGCFLP